MPFKVVELAVLEFFLGALGLLRGFSAIEAGRGMDTDILIPGLAQVYPWSPVVVPGLELEPSGYLVLQRDLALVFGVLLVVIGSLYLLETAALSTVQPWSRKLGIVVVLAGVGADFSILYLNGAVGSIVGLILEGAALYFLTRSDVRDFFRPGPPTDVSQSGVADHTHPDPGT